MIEKFSNTTDTITAVLDGMAAKLIGAKAHVKDELSQMKIRANFHHIWGLEKVKFIAEHDFTRGWTVFEERTLDYVTINYQEVAAYIWKTIEMVKELDPSDIITRKMLYITLDKDLYKKEVLASRALANITEAAHAFATGEPLLTYLASPGRRYDMSYITLEVVQSSPYFKEAYDVKLMKRTGQFLNETIFLRELIKPISVGEEVNETLIASAITRWESRARSYNYYKFIYTDRVMNAPGKYSDVLIETFNQLNETVWNEFDNLDRIVQKTISFLNKVDDAWSMIVNLKNKSVNYLENKTATKTELAEAFTSKESDEALRTMALFFTEARSMSREMTEALGYLQYSYQDMWSSMLTEATLTNFYQMVYDDVMYSKQNNTFMLYIDGKFGYMIKEKAAWVRNNIDEMYVRMNADFSITDVTAKINEISKMFDDTQSLFVISDVLEDNDVSFLKATYSLNENLDIFLRGNEVGHEFYR